MPAQKRTLQKKKSIKEILLQNRKLLAISIVLIAGLGTYLLFFAHAATNNCQAENQVQICDVDQTGGGSDTVLSTNGEAESLGGQGWGTYYGAAFRAPMSAYQGAVPVHRVYNPTATWHEYLTAPQQGQKEAKAGGADKLKDEGYPFFAWTDGHVPGTVPVYRLTRLGAATQAVYSTDKGWIDNMLALDAGNDAGWKNNYLDAIAFYAFPPNYKVAGQANPYDCSIFENYVSPRCAQAAKNLQTAIDNGSIPKSTACPTDLATYIKNPLSSSYPADCQTYWRGKMQDCTMAENVNTDRCKTQKATLATTQKTQVAKRQAAVPKKGGSGGSGSSSSSSGGKGGSGGTTAYAACYDSSFLMAASKGRRDGKPFDPACLKVWQGKAGTKADGSWGPATQAALNTLAALTNSPASKPPVCPAGTHIDPNNHSNPPCTKDAGSTPAAPATAYYRCHISYVEHGGTFGAFNGEKTKDRYVALSKQMTRAEADKACSSEFDKWKGSGKDVEQFRGGWVTTDWQQKIVKNMKVVTEEVIYNTLGF